MKFDSYTLKARVMPVFLVLMPVVLSVIAWWPHLASGIQIPVAVLTYSGLAFLFSQFGRDLGKRKEPRLFELWEGKPTTRLLRHRHTALDPVTLARYHSVLGTLIGRPFPTVKEEVDDEAGADAVYESAVRFLLERTRDRNAFSLIAAENTNYGFRRNLWGMKPAATFLCMISLLVTLGPVLRAVMENLAIPVLSFACASAVVVLLVWWTMRINANWVRLAADAYAQRLLAACENIRGTGNGG